MIKHIGQSQFLNAAAAAIRIAYSNAIYAEIQENSSGSIVITSTGGVIILENVHLKGGIFSKSVNKTADYTATITDDLINVDATITDTTITLPPLSTAWDAVNNIGLELTIVKTDTTSNRVIIDGNASETINGALTQSSNIQWSGFKIKAVSTTDWRIIS